MKIRLLAALCLLNLFMGYSQQKNYDKEIEQLLSRMTLEEKNRSNEPVKLRRYE